MLKYTVGMACYDHPTSGVDEAKTVMTVMALLHYHYSIIGEVIVVDNNPQPNSTLAAFLKKNKRIRYIPMDTPRGTAAPRNRIFTESDFDHTVVIDPHVHLMPGTLEAVDQFYRMHGYNCKDILHGIMVNEDGTPHATHMNDQWRDGMWGTWGLAWTKGKFNQFSVQETEFTGMCEFVSMGSDGTQRPLTPVELTALGINPMPWRAHQQKLRALGFAQPGIQPFVIPGHGMGFFVVRTAAWLPFHSEARGFGGEEMTTHARFRQAGRKAWCLPHARWWHWTRDQRGGDPPLYRNTYWDRVRNYRLEMLRLGMPLDRLHEEFVGNGIMGDAEWNQIIVGRNWPLNPLIPRPADMPPDTEDSNVE